MVITKTPLRISLVGGGTDLKSFYEHYVGGVVSFAISKFVYISVNKKFDGRIRVSYSQTENVDNLDELQHDLVRESLRSFKIEGGVEITSVSDVPGQGTGLGSSSAFTVGLLNALGREQHPAILAERAYRVEAEQCRHSVGKQDHYISAYGGMNYMRFHPKRVEVEVLYPKKDMENNFLLLWTGKTRPAGNILEEQSRRFKSGDTLLVGKELAQLAYRFRNGYLEGMDYARMGELLHEGWELKKHLSTVSDPQIDEWYEIGMKHGAYGGKLLGAGGGGFLFFIAPFDTHAQIAEATGLRRIDFKIVNSGSEVIYNGQ